MDSYRIITTKTAAETQKVAAELAGELLEGRGPRILCLSGPLGAGKTTFVRGFAQGLGINRRILSPTFVLVRRYGIPKTGFRFYHLDLYRLGDAEIRKDESIPEILTEPGVFAAVEWAEKLGRNLPEHRWDIGFSAREDGHEISIRKINHG